MEVKHWNGLWEKPGWDIRRHHGAVDHNQVEASQPWPTLTSQTSSARARIYFQDVSSSSVILVLHDQ